MTAAVASGVSPEGALKWESPGAVGVGVYSGHIVAHGPIMHTHVILYNLGWLRYGMVRARADGRHAAWHSGAVRGWDPADPYIPGGPSA